MLTITRTKLCKMAAMLLTAVLLSTSGCALIEKIRSPEPQEPQQKQQKQQRQKQATKPVNPKAQQHYYDLGLQLYSKENYQEARKAFQQVVDNGPGTTLGLKAQENINKIDQILKTLEDIESK
jgi:TolA-binding protein